VKRGLSAADAGRNGYGHHRRSRHRAVHRINPTGSHEQACEEAADTGAARIRWRPRARSHAGETPLWCERPRKLGGRYRAAEAAILRSGLRPPRQRREFDCAYLGTHALTAWGDRLLGRNLELITWSETTDENCHFATVETGHDNRSRRAGGCARPFQGRHVDNALQRQRHLLPDRSRRPSDAHGRRRDRIQRQRHLADAAPSISPTRGAIKAGLSISIPMMAPSPIAGCSPTIRRPESGRTARASMSTAACGRPSSQANASSATAPTAALTGRSRCP